MHAMCECRLIEGPIGVKATVRPVMGIVGVLHGGFTGLGHNY